MDGQTKADRWMDGQKNNVALVLFGCIPPSGLGGDSVTNRWKDRGTNRGTHNIPITKAWG